MKLQSHFSQLEKTRIIKNTDLISYLLSLPRYLSLNIFKELEALRLLCHITAVTAVNI